MFQLCLAAAASHYLATLDGRLNLREAAIATLHEVLTRCRNLVVQTDTVQPRPTATQYSHHDLYDVGKRRAALAVVSLHALSVISDGLGIWLVGIVPHFNQTFWGLLAPLEESLLRVHYPQ
jgi:hypothetical protein